MVSVGYGRRYRDPALTLADQARQGATLSTYTENSYTNAVLLPDAYRAPLPAQTSIYELIQFLPDATRPGITNLFGFDEIANKVQQAGDGNHEIPYEELSPAGLNVGEHYRRLTEQSRTLYRPDDLGEADGSPTALLPLGTLNSLALPGSSYKLAFTSGLVAQVYRRGGQALLPAPANVLGDAGPDGGGYVDLDGDGSWWVPSGRLFYSAVPLTSAQEKAAARQHFFMPRRFEDAFGKVSLVDYEAPHDLLILRTTDAVGNVSTATNDYRVLAPVLLTDPNGNRAAVSLDLLAIVVGTAVMGKTTENLGDSLEGFNPDLTQTQIDSFYAASDPRALAGALLGSATTRIVYDARQFLNSRNAAPNDPSKWEPVFAASLARETHVSDLAGADTSRVYVTFGYFDGYGREIQKKIPAEPGPVVDDGPSINPRWVGSGWTIFNNTGKPVRRYEPFFSQLPKGHRFEFGVQVGVSPVLCYDPVERAVSTIHPNHTYEKVVFDPWHKVAWDVNDTVLQTDPTTDADVGDFFKRLPAATYSPAWHAQRIAGGLGVQEQDAAAKTTAHANTPIATYFDALGRTFLTLLDNGGGVMFPSRVELDTQGNQRAVRDAIVQLLDAQGRVVMRSDFEMLRNRIHQASMDSGERWILNDCTGKPIRSWDSRGHNFRTEYDALRRLTGMFVLGTDNVNSDPRTTAAEVLYEKISYGEGQPQALNLHTRIFQHADAAGVVTNMGHNPITNQDEGYDFKGNPLRSSRAFVADYKALPDWSSPPPTPDGFTSSIRYDALNRPVAMTAPDGSVIRPAYNEAKLLESVNVDLPGAAGAAAFITNVNYNAKGQRTLIAYGNANTQTGYTYDPLTSRLTNLQTTRPVAPANQQMVQALSYTYDPAGNITHIQDDADIQNVVFFRNRRVEPGSDFTYDAIYRLINAEGREQLGLGNGGKPLPPAATSYNNVPRVGLPHPGDGNAMGIYSEQYQYDAVGNFLQFIHRGSDPAHPGWTRSYTYNEISSLETGKFSNRLTRSATSGDQPFNEPYTYDLHGNMTGMPQLQAMRWDFKDQLNMTRRQAVNASDQDGALHQGERTFYVYDASGQRVRKATESAAGGKRKERFYLGALELYREYDGLGEVALARETLHVMDDKKRVALVETKTIDASVPPTSLPSSTTRYQFDNHLGTACLELDENAAVISYEEYYPYGSTSYQAGRTLAEVSLKRYRYTGKEKDEESGLYYHGARYYLDWIGRWTRCDPLGIADGPNPYVYVSCNPVRLCDSSGMQGEDTIPVDLSRTVREGAQSALRRADRAGVGRLRPHIPTVPTARHVEPASQSPAGRSPNVTPPPPADSAPPQPPQSPAPTPATTDSRPSPPDNPNALSATVTGTATIPNPNTVTLETMYTLQHAPAQGRLTGAQELISLRYAFRGVEVGGIATGAQPLSSNGPNQYSIGPLVRFGPTDLSHNNFLQPGGMLSLAYNQGPDQSGNSTSYFSATGGLSLSHGDKFEPLQLDITLGGAYAGLGNFGPQAATGDQRTASNVFNLGGSAQGTLYPDAMHNHPITLEVGDFLLGGGPASGPYQLGNRFIVGASVSHYFNAGGNTRAGLIFSADFAHESYAGGTANSMFFNLNFVINPR
jgi:RHS repeat-associated protein